MRWKKKKYCYVLLMVYWKLNVTFNYSVWQNKKEENIYKMKVDNKVILQTKATTNKRECYQP